MKNKLILISAALLIIIFGLLFNRSFLGRNDKVEPSPPPTPEVEQAVDKVSVSIDFGSGEKVAEEYSLSDNFTAFSVLEMLAENNDISLETESYDFGVFVKSINNMESSADMSWIYFVNGESGQVAADQNKLNPDDKVEWRYIAPEY